MLVDISTLEDCAPEFDLAKTDPELDEILVDWCRSKKEGKNPFVYVQGTFYRRKATTFQRKDIKVKPNEPCTCGSSKKFKKCCG